VAPKSWSFSVAGLAAGEFLKVVEQLLLAGLDFVVFVVHRSTPAWVLKKEGIPAAGSQQVGDQGDGLPGEEEGYIMP
jgi:hypothetical protein